MLVPLLFVVALTAAAAAVRGAFDPTADPATAATLPLRVAPAKALQAFIAGKAAALKRREDIAKLIAHVTEARVRAHALVLSGENSTLRTRVSTSRTGADGFAAAADYVRQRMTSYGFDVVFDDYRPDFGPNVVSTLVGTSKPTELVVLGAHLDDIPSSGRAPGANDDGAGSSALLAMAEAIHASGVRFERTLVFEHYSGEEQGLIGSRSLSARRKERGDDVRAMIQQDMTAVRRSGDPIGVAFVRDTRATDPELTAYVMQVADKYKDERLTTFDRVISGSECCSDHQPYASNGYPSAGLIEPRGYTGDPQYHRSGDLVRRDDYSTLQSSLAAQVALAAGADLAEIAA